MAKVSAYPELNYMTQIVFMLFEDVSQPEESCSRYRVDLHFSPGVKGREELLKGGPSTSNSKLSPDLLAKSLLPVKRISCEGSDGLWRQGGVVDSPHFMPRLQHVPVPIGQRKTSVPSILKSASDGQLLRGGTRRGSTPMPIVVTNRRFRLRSESESNSDLYSSSTSVLERGGMVVEYEEDTEGSDDSNPGFQFVVGSNSPPKKPPKSIPAFENVIAPPWSEDSPEIGGMGQIGWSE